MPFKRPLFSGLLCYPVPVEIFDPMDISGLVSDRQSIPLEMQKCFGL